MLRMNCQWFTLCIHSGIVIYIKYHALSFKSDKTFKLSDVYSMMYSVHYLNLTVALCVWYVLMVGSIIEH